MQDDHIAQDIHSWKYPNGMSKMNKFWEFIFPWFILLALVFGIYLMLIYGLEFMIELSEPLSKVMKGLGI